eukprot:3521560-Prymnesium_polylepis.1
MGGPWREALGDGQEIYFYNSETNETTWTRPADADMEEIPPMPAGEPPPFATVVPAPAPYAPPMEAMPPYAPPADSYGMPPPADSYGMPAPYGSGYPPPAGGAPPYGQAGGWADPNFQPVLAPPPKPPPMLHPQQLEPAPLPPQPGQEEFFRRPDNWPGRSYHKSLGESIHRFQETPGNVRHDIIIEK